MERNIYLFGEIDEEVALDVISQINEIEDYDNKATSDMEVYNKPCIKLYINSVGGSLVDGLAIIDKIQTCETHINTIALGNCQSMALAIFVSGDIRSSGRFTQFMYHQAYSEPFGITADLERQLSYTRELQKIYNDIILDNTAVPKGVLETWEKLEQDVYLDAEKCLNYQICDEIL